MGLFKKVKEILFDEEEYTEQIKITPEMRNEETPLKEEKKEVERPVVKEPVRETVREEKVEPVRNNSEVSERELFKTNSSFPFLDFDEEEFETAKPEPKFEEVPKRPSNVFEYEKRKKIEKRTDFGRYERTETLETTERKKFKPSPIISPVYGILDRDYVQSDIMHRKDVDKVDIKSVRDKAFGEKKEAPKVEVKEEVLEPKTTFYEETETVTISAPSEKEKKVKTIDELLEDTSDIAIDIDRDLNNDIEMDLDRELEDIIPKAKEEKEEVEEKTAEMKIPEVEDTLENDLFDLIDSMYDSKEDGE